MAGPLRSATPTLAVALALTLLTGAARAEEGADDLVVIRAGAVITVSGEELRPGMVVIRGGKIEAVGARVEIPPQARVIEASDETVMPGLIDLRSRFGLTNYGRSGNHADLDVLPELFFRPGELEPLLEAGFVAVGLVPAGRGVPGRATVIRPLDGPLSEIVVPGAGYLRITLSGLPSDKQTLRAAFAEAKQSIEREEKARKDWEEKQKKAAEAKKRQEAERKKQQEKETEQPKREGAFAQKKQQGAAKPAASEPAKFVPPPVPARARPFVAILKGEEQRGRVLLELGRASDLVHLEDGFGRHEHFAPLLFLDNDEQSDLYLGLERLAKAPLVVLRPRISMEPYTATRRNLPAELVRAGARIAFVPLSDGAEGHAELLEAVAFLVRDGLPRAAALAAVTLHAAEALGLGAELGAIEPGRRADLTFFDGDPLGPSPRVSRVMIEGELRFERGNP